MFQQQLRKTVVNCHPSLDMKFSETSPHKAMLPFILSLSILTVHLWVSTAQPTVIINNATSSIYVQNVNNGAFFLNSSSPSTWSNNNSINRTISSGDGFTLRLLLTQGSSDLGYGCGFFCNGSCNSYYLSVVIGSFYGRGSYQQSRIPKVVWTANRDRPVRENATLELTQDGDLILHDSDHTKVWSTDTAGMSVAGMNVTTQGNLVLFNERGAVVWQSFDHPTDALLFGQELYEGQRLNASISAANWSSGFNYYALTTSFSFAAFVQVEANTPLMYFQLVLEPSRRNSSGPIYTTVTSFPVTIRFPFEDYPQYIKLGSDGHLRFYQWASEGWQEQSDLVVQEIDECQYPHSCGEYGVCNEGQCSCPEGIDGVGYFKRIQSQLPNRGCSRITPLSCEASSDKHHLVDFGNLSYFNLMDQNAAVPKLNDVDRCKQACLQNCSCEAAFFKHGDNFSDGYCYLISRVLSIRAKPIPGYNFSSSAFIKVRSPYLAPSPEPISRSTPESPLLPTSRKQTNLAAIIAGSAVGTVLMIFLLVALCVLVSRKKNVEEGDEYFNLVPGMPMKFSYEDLRIATEDFKERLGRGGFGSVFKGTLEDGMGIAVKRLDNVGQGVKEFLAEVETIGSIHHINLVRLVGFCVEKSHRLLVYEHMSNGSLDNWIFNKNQNPTLDWQTRKKIILNVAKGLAYLHEECRQRIVHLDIKPQNILLDDNFNAKVSDFGLSKLIDGDQSQVLTNMRGTPGYLAPEWHQLRITVKADIYSFGIVVLEIVCGRRNFDRSRAESSAHLLGLLEKKAEDNQLIDIVDEMSEDMRLHGEEVMKMIRTAAWCLQDDHTRRPLMSVVVKVLEGVMEVDPDISYRFSNAVAHPVETGVPVSSAPPQATILSGPR